MADAFDGCVMLALSTFRQSEKAVLTAVEKAREPKKLLLAYVVDVNLARYFIGSEHGLYSDVKDKCEAELLKRADVVFTGGR